MGENSNIEWTDHTFNPWIGCAKVSPGCVNCYAETQMEKRLGVARWGKGQPRVRTSVENWKKPIKWDAAAARAGIRAKVFCASQSDWLDEEVPLEWLADLLVLIYSTPYLDWLLLTKRPQNFEKRLKAAIGTMHVDPLRLGERVLEWVNGMMIPQNVWMGTSVEDQARADERIPLLNEIPARVRFLSVEPMLERIDFQSLRCKWDNNFDGNCSEHPHGCPQFIHWAIFGGESGFGARPCGMQWIREGIRVCKNAGVKVFVKQLGADPFEFPMTNRTTCDGRFLPGVMGKKGGNFEAWPEDLKVREWPAKGSFKFQD